MLDLERLAPETVRPISRAEYDEMVALGMFEDERVELLHGVLVRMSPQGVPHALGVQRVNLILTVAVAGRAIPRPQLPFAAGDDSEPEPDFAIVPLDYCETDHPSQALLVVEVASSSLSKDRHIKADLYAAAGIPEYWIVNLVDECVEVHTEPRDGSYTEETRQARGGRLTLAALPNITVEVDSLLP